MISWAYIILNIDERRLGFDEKLSRSSNTKRVIGSLATFCNFNTIFMDYIFVSLGVSILVTYVPSKRFEEGIEELLAKPKFFVSS